MAHHVVRRKILRFILWAVFLLLLPAFLFYMNFEPAKEITWGVNFSIPQAVYLGFDWKKMYFTILEDLRPQKIRVMAYWEILEPEPNKFDFSDFYYVLQEAQKRSVEVVLVLGHKQPRWPECHHPDWYEKLSAAQKEQAILSMLENATRHFREFSNIGAWQVENEPFFPYGPADCGRVPKELLEKEIKLVRSLDTRPVVVTDSGEKGAWLPTVWVARLAARQGGVIFGSTIYRNIYHDKKQKYIKYPIPPSLYRLKAGMVKVFSPIDEFWGVELQAEPWFATDVYQTPWEEQDRLMNPEILREYAGYARRIGFAENYFWGVEWWYWAKSQGHPEMWETAKKMINNN